MSFVPVVDMVKLKKNTDTPKFGTVVDNNDPDMVGKIKVEIPGIMEGSPEQLPWVRRKQDVSFCGIGCEIFDVPDVGAVVEVRWDYDRQTPTYSGTPVSQKHTTKEFTENYPYQGGIKFGPHIIKFDKQTEVMIITNGTNKITLEPDGKTHLECTNLVMDVQETTELNCTNLNMNVSSKTTLNCPTTEITGDVIIDKTLNTKQAVTFNSTLEVDNKVTMNSSASVSTTLTAGTDVKGGSVSLKNHTHNYKPGPGNDTPTSKPN